LSGEASRRRSWRRPPVRSAVRQDRSCREYPRRGLHERAKVHHLVGHWGSSTQVGSATRPYRRIANDRRKPLARYGAMESALRERLAPRVLPHRRGHDRFETVANSRISYFFRPQQQFRPSRFASQMTRIARRSNRSERSAIATVSASSKLSPASDSTQESDVALNNSKNRSVTPGKLAQQSCRLAASSTTAHADNGPPRRRPDLMNYRQWLLVGPRRFRAQPNGSADPTQTQLRPIRHERHRHRRTDDRRRNS